MKKYDPLERILARLELYAELGDRVGFLQTKPRFYETLGYLNNGQVVRLYQVRYDQLKFMLNSKILRIKCRGIKND